MKCEVCSAEVSELRRGRCWGCYTRWTDERPVGVGARCCVCGERRRELLKSVELLGHWRPICHGCAGCAAKLDPMPQRLEEIRAALRRERRQVERRHGKKDTRVFQYDRRNADRRAGRADGAGEDLALLDIDDEMIVEIEELVGEERRRAERDLTRIHDLG